MYIRTDIRSLAGRERAIRLLIIFFSSLILFLVTKYLAKNASCTLIYFHLHMSGVLGADAHRPDR